jgi:large subunit ribosomal protein L29
MTLPKYKDLKDLNTSKLIEEEIFLIQKELFNLRIKKATNQSIKSHLFKHLKRRLAQLLFKNSIIIN